MQEKEKNGKLDYVKIKNVHASKNIINKIKRKHTELNKILPNHTYNKDLVSRIHRDLIKRNYEKINNQI